MPWPIQESSTRVLRIALISSNPVMRMGLRMILNTPPFVATITDVSLGAHAVDSVVQEKPQVIIVDLELADADPVALIRELHAAAVESHILVLSGLSDEQLTRGALSAGAEGVVLTIQPPAVLFAAIDSLCGFALRPMDSRPAQSVTGLNSDRPSARSNDRTRTGFVESLTSREREVIHSLAKGFKNKEIADRLCISQTTVRHHFTAIFSKLQVSNRQQLLITAHQQGLVEFGTG